jgi:hypothetical protein
MDGLINGQNKSLALGAAAVLTAVGVLYYLFPPDKVLSSRSDLLYLVFSTESSSPFS